jgi:hypothetical protein
MPKKKPHQRLSARICGDMRGYAGIYGEKTYSITRIFAQSYWNLCPQSRQTT